MRQAPSALKCLFLLACLCLLSMAAYAQAAPTAAATDTTISPNLTIYGSYGNSVLVQILNLTPFDMTYASGSLANQRNTDRKTKKSFMFTPVGVPGTICGSAVYPIKQASGSYQYQYNPAYHTLAECKGRLQTSVTSVVAPVPFMVSWEDDGGLIKDTSLVWTMHDVICNAAPRLIVPGDGCTAVTDFDGETTYKADINLGLWFNRTGTDRPPQGQFFHDTMDTLEKAISLVRDIESPLTWLDAFLAAKELAEHVQDFEEWNMGDHTGVRMTVHSYPVPHPGSGCVNNPVCVPDIYGTGADDNVTLQWASAFDTSAGEAEAGVVVTTHVLRSHDAANNEYYDKNNLLRCCNFKFGSLTTVNITLMLPNQYATAAVHTMATATSPAQLRHVLLSNGFGRIREYLLRHGRDGLFALRDVVLSLPPADVQLLMQATQSTLTGQARKEEEEVLRTVAKALETGRRP